MDINIQGRPQRKDAIKNKKEPTVPTSGVRKVRMQKIVILRLLRQEEPGCVPAAQRPRSFLNRIHLLSCPCSFKEQLREFAGSLVVRTQHSYCQGPGSIPGQGTKIPQAAQ